jgi:uncharacterized protein YyaL (SSP411 family)
MAKESFANADIAAYLNAHFVAIKVDREEHPEVDAIYIAAVEAMGNPGGWPLNVWLTPEGQPFFGTTYLDAVAFRGLLERIVDQYQKDPKRVAEQAALVTQVLQEKQKSSVHSPGVAGFEVIIQALAGVKKEFDPIHGGLKSNSAKFPSNLPIRLLLRAERKPGAGYRDMADKTLRAMAAGGIHDHLGGGFHRYSTDPRWQVPHFEKMLYDNALLALDYLEGYQALRSQSFGDVAQGILDFVARELTSPEGGFYSALDADETYYTWTPEQIKQALGREGATRFLAYYDVSAKVLFADRPDPGLETSLEPLRKRLFEARQKRKAPAADQKILTGWNGLMISAFARAARILDRPNNLEHATRAAQFVLTKLAAGDRLHRVYGQGAARLDGNLEDYAFFVQALIDVFEATGDPDYLGSARRLVETVEQRFLDPQSGTYFRTEANRADLVVRERPIRDDAMPSGNSVMAMNWLRLYALTGHAHYRSRADRMFVGLSEVMRRQGATVPHLLLALDFRTADPKEVVLVTPTSRADAEPFLSVLATTFAPHHVLVVKTPANQEGLAGYVPGVLDKPALRGQATAYVCEQGRCLLPTTDPAVFARQVQ